MSNEMNGTSIEQLQEIMRQQENMQKQQNMQALSNDINEKLDKMPLYTHDDELSQNDLQLPLKEPHKDKGFFKIPEILKEPLIILIIFIIMSLQPVRDTFGKYINVINPNQQTGEVSILGITIYGLIFALLFVAIKSILPKIINH